MSRTPKKTKAAPTRHKRKGKTCACGKCKPPISVKQFQEALDRIVDQLVKDDTLTTAARDIEYASLAHAVVIEGAGMHAALHGYPPDSQPYLVYEHDPFGRLIHAAKTFAQYTQVPLEAVIDSMLMHMDPRARLNAELRWN